MLQFNHNLNVLMPGTVFAHKPAGVSLRGHMQTEPVAIPSHLKVALSQKKIPKPASVGDLTFYNCPTRRDFFLSMCKTPSEDTWGRHAGVLIEEYLTQLAKDHLSDTPKKPGFNYRTLREEAEKSVKKLEKVHAKKFSKLNKFEKPGDDGGWFTRNLSFVGMHELASQETALMLAGGGGTKLMPNKVTLHPTASLGIAANNEPDFVFPELKLIGDVKTGEDLKSTQLLTCVGYALAYESEFPESQIDYGMIYFYSTRRNAVSFPQIYTFCIDDELRNDFLGRRNAAYELLLKHEKTEPPFPSDTSKCLNCKFKAYCEKKGLKLV